MGPPCGRCCLQSAHSRLPNRAIKTRTRGIFISLCALRRRRKLSVLSRPAPLSREAKRQLSFYPPAISSLARTHSRSRRRPQIYMHKQKLRCSIHKLFHSRPEEVSHLIFVHLQWHCTFQCARDSCAHALPVQVLGRTFVYLCTGPKKHSFLLVSARLLNYCQVCGKSESGKCCQFPCFFSLPVCQFWQNRKKSRSYQSRPMSNKNIVARNFFPLHRLYCVRSDRKHFWAAYICIYV